ncbi:MAG: efflux RND transporter periplasmic adaptor subunit [Pseudomonadota bacterium]
MEQKKQAPEAPARTGRFGLRLGGMALVIGIVLGGVLLMSPEKAAIPEDAVIVELERHVVEAEVRAEGEIRARGQVPIFPRVQGQVVGTTDERGEVDEGDVLVELEDRALEREVREAEAALWSVKADESVAETRLGRAQTEARRARRLANEELIPREEAEKAQTELESARGALEVARAKVRQAEIRRDSAQEDLDRTVIRAPFDGVLLSMNAEVGQPVSLSAGQPLVTMAPDLEHLRLRLEVNEVDIGRVRTGQEVMFSIESHPGREFHATVREIEQGGREDGGVRVYRVMADVTAVDDATLLPGMSVRARLRVGDGKPRLAVPLAALSYRPPKADLSRYEDEVSRLRGEGLTVVWVVDEEGEIRPHGVSILFQDDDYAAIEKESGTEEGLRVLMDA